MTSHESFKKRVRARMATTGERYNAARRALLASATPPAGTGWAAQPTVSDARVRENTGRAWDAWVEVIDAGPGRAAGHAEIAAWLRDDQGVGGWWAQTVTVGYERITGVRLPGQMPDGTFSVSRSRTLDLDADELRAAFLDDDDRAVLFSGIVGALRSRPTAKTLRFAVADGASGADVGVVSLAVDRAKGRTRLTVTHAGLPTFDAGEAWKEYWRGWLDALATDSPGAAPATR